MANFSANFHAQQNAAQQSQNDELAQKRRTMLKDVGLMVLADFFLTVILITFLFGK